MFSRRLPAHLLPGLEFAIDRYLGSALRDLKAPEDFEVCVVPVSLPRSLDYLKPYVGESDESIPQEVSDDDNA